jgi:hypothetical protein
MSMICKYYRQRDGIGFCDYSIITGLHRDCYNYDCAANTERVDNKMDNIKTESKVIPATFKNSKEKSAWWDRVHAELAKGRDKEIVAAEYGVTEAQINKSIGQRKRSSAGKQSPNQIKSSTKEQINPALQTEPVMPGVEKMALTINTSIVNEAYIRTLTLVNNIRIEDNIKIKAATLLLVGEIISQASDSLEV